MNQILEKHGFLFIPEANKIPLTSFSNAVTRMFDFSTEFGNINYTGIGIIVPDGMVIIDIDLHDMERTGEKEFNKLCSKLGELPRSYTVTTPSGGFHLYFQIPKNLKLKYGHIAPEIEAKLGKNCKVTSPYTKGYNASNTDIIAELPNAWLEHMIEVLPHEEKEESQPTTIIHIPTVKEPADLYTDEEMTEFCYSSAEVKYGPPCDNHRFDFIRSYAFMCASYGVPEPIACGNASRIGNTVETEKKIQSIYSSTFKKWDYLRHPLKKKDAYQNKIDELTQKALDKIISSPTLSRTTQKKYIDIPFLTLTANQHLDDISRLINVSHKYVYIVSPTGSGKTHFALITLAKMFPDKKIIVLLPKIIAVKQKMTSYDNVHGVFGAEQYIDNILQAGTYDSLSKLLKVIDPDDCILVIDEAHTLSMAKNYRTDAINYILETYQNYYKTIMMSATPTIIPEDFYKIEVRREIVTKTKFNIVKYNKDNSVYEVVSDNLIQNKINLIYLNNTRQIESVVKTINTIDGRKAYPLYRDADILSATPDLYHTIVNDCCLPEDTTDIVMTVFGEEALDIYLNENQSLGSANFLYIHDYTPINIIQTINRFRNSQFEMINIYIKDNPDFQIDHKFDHKLEQYREKAEAEALAELKTLRQKSSDFFYNLTEDEKIILLWDKVKEKYTNCPFGVHYKYLQRYKQFLQNINPYCIIDDMVEAGFSYNKTITANYIDVEFQRKMKLFNKLQKEEKKAQWTEWCDELSKTMDLSEYDRDKDGRYLLFGCRNDVEKRVLELINRGYAIDDAIDTVRNLGFSKETWNTLIDRLYFQRALHEGKNRLINDVYRSFQIGECYSKAEIHKIINAINKKHLSSQITAPLYEGYDNLDFNSDVETLKRYSNLNSQKKRINLFKALFSVKPTTRRNDDDSSNNVFRIVGKNI